MKFLTRLLITSFFFLSSQVLAEEVTLSKSESKIVNSQGYHAIKLQSRIDDLELKMQELYDQIEKIDLLLAQISAQINILEEGRPIEILSPDYNRDEFEYGFEMLMQNKLDLAYDTFDLFIRKYPNDLKVGEAYYWLGEVEYQRGAYDKALEYFLKVYKEYKSSIKRNDALYKMSIVLAALDKKKEACDGFIILINHTPNVTPSLEQMARADALSTGCLNDE